MLAFLGPVLNFLGGPVVKGIVDAYKAKLAAGNTADKIAADLAARELAVQQVEVQAQNQLRVAEIGHFWEPDKLAEYVFVIVLAKIWIWDNLLGWGSTPALHGEAEVWMNYIVSFMFGKRGIENVVRIWKRQ